MIWLGLGRRAFRLRLTSFIIILGRISSSNWSWMVEVSFFYLWKSWICKVRRIKVHPNLPQSNYYHHPFLIFTAPPVANLTKQTMMGNPYLVIWVIYTFTFFNRQSTTTWRQKKIENMGENVIVLEIQKPLFISHPHARCFLTKYLPLMNKCGVMNFYYIVVYQNSSIITNLKGLHLLNFLLQRKHRKLAR